MPASALYHDTVVEALKADGWTITHDPYHVAYGNRNLYIVIFTLIWEQNEQRSQQRKTIEKLSLKSKVS